MGKYGEVAIKAVEICKKNIDPVEAWNMAAKDVFSNSNSSIKKVCPKSAFLGLCEEGLIKNISSGSYTRSVDNKKYAIEALALLKEKPELKLEQKKLWEMIMKGKEKKHNSQLDVVISLFEAGFTK